MEIEINKDVLFSPLSICQKLVPKEPTKGSTEYALLERINSKTTLFYSNCNQSIKILLKDFPNGENLKQMLPVHNVAEYLKTLPDGEVKITFTETSERGLYNINIKIPKRSKKVFTTKHTVDEYPRYIASPKESIKLSFIKLSTILSYCKGFEYGVKEGGVTWLNGILFIFENNSLSVLTSNKSTHSVLARMETNSELQHIIALPSEIHDVFEFLSDMENDNLHISISDRNVFFRNRKMVLYSSIIDNKPSDSSLLEQFVKPTGDSISVYPSSVSVAVRRLSIGKTTGNEARAIEPVKVSHEEGWFVLSKQEDDRERIDADILEYGKSVNDIHMDIRSLNKVMRKISSGRVNITLPDGKVNFMHIQPEIDNNVTFYVFGIHQ